LEGMVAGKSKDDLGDPHGERKPLRTADVLITSKKSITDISTHSVTQMSLVVYQIITAQ